MTLRFQRAFHAELHYRVLAHLDLGRDAASIFDPSLPRPSWAGPLLEAYRADPRCLRTQFLPLHTLDLEALRAVLGSDATALARRLEAALDAEAPRLRAAWAPPIEPTFAPVLQTLRNALYSADPPPLRVLDCRSLGRHGRAMTVAGVRVVAVSLAEAPEHALCQIFHEEVHPISDKDLEAQNRDTRAGSPGHATHQAMEAHAVAVGREVVTRTAPEWLAAYDAWAGRFGM